MVDASDFVQVTRGSNGKIIVDNFFQKAESKLLGRAVVVVE